MAVTGKRERRLMKIQLDATVCRYLFTAKSLYMFQVSQHPSSGVPKTVAAASGTGHNIGTATSFQQLLPSNVASYFGRRKSENGTKRVHETWCFSFQHM